MKENIYTIEYILENNIDKTAYGFIYITTNLINGKKYIGQKKFETGNHKYRWKNYLGSGVLFTKAIRKYGKGKFSREIISKAYSKEELDTLEIEFIKKYNAVEDEKYYNLEYGGHSSKHSEETRKKISELNKGKIISEEVKIKMRESAPIRIGKLNPNYGNDKFRREKHWNYGNHLSEETKKKMSESSIGNKSRSTQIICLTTKKVFNSVIEASIYYGCDNSNVCKCCHGKAKSCGKLENGTKLQWMFYEDYLKLHNENKAI